MSDTFFLDIFDLLEMYEKYKIEYSPYSNICYFYSTGVVDFPYFNDGKLCTKAVKRIQDHEWNEVLNDVGHSLSPPLLCAYIKLLFEKANVTSLIIPYGDKRYEIAKCVPWVYDIDLMNALYPNRNFIICRRNQTLVYKGGEMEIIPLDVSRLMKYAVFQNRNNPDFNNPDRFYPDRNTLIETIDEYENYWKTLQQRSRLGIDFMRDRFVVYGLTAIHYCYMKGISIQYGISDNLNFEDNESKLENDITFQNILDKVCRDHVMYRYIIYLKMFGTIIGKRSVFDAIPISSPTLDGCENPIDIKLLKEIYDEVGKGVTALSCALFYINNLKDDIPMILFPLRAMTKEVIKEIDDLVDFVNRHK